MDRVLGVGGLVLAGVGIVSLPFRLEVAGDPENVNALFGVATAVWMAAITVRHLRSHPGAAGRSLLRWAWLVLGVLVAVTVIGSVDTAAFDEGLVEGLRSLLASPPRLALIPPLVLASLAILRDVGSGPGPVGAST